MIYRAFPKFPDRKISAIGFGGASLSGDGGGYGFGPISEAEAISLVQAAVEQGVNLFDTAPIYGFGESERRLGRALKGLRDKVFIISKSGVTWDNNKRVDIDNSVTTTQRMLDQSLRDLQTDYIDLYMIHWPDSRNDIRYTLEYLERRREVGCLGSIGLSNTNAEDLRRAQEITPILAIQEEYNLFVRSTKQAWLADVSSHQLGYITWGTLDKGILSGRVTAERTFQKPDARAHAPWWKKADRTNKYAAVSELKELTEPTDLTLLDLAIHGALANRTVTSCLVGVKNLAQLESLMISLSKTLPDELLKSADTIIAKWIQ